MNYYLRKFINSFFDFVVPVNLSKKYKVQISEFLNVNQLVSITFICTGNICRSAFCEHEFLPYKEDYSVNSCGLFTNAGKKADPSAVKYAEKMSVSLTSHRTNELSLEALRSSSIIFVMEPWQLVYIILKAPSLYKKIFLLSSLTRENLDSWTIEDPFQKNKLVFEEVFSTLKKCNENIRTLKR